MPWLSWFPWFRPSSAKDQAFAIFTEFGPALRIPRFQRLQACFPHEREETILAWIRDFERFDKLIWKVAEAGAAEAYSYRAMAEIFRKDFPDLGDASFRIAYGRARYYAWHEGFTARRRNA